MKSLADCRVLLESALAYNGGTFEYEDVVREVEAGQAQFWPGPNSVIITQIDEQPQRKVLQFFLAAGTSTELAAMEPAVLAWGKEQGCTVARLVGRKGWKRATLVAEGWRDMDLVILEKEIA